jgi:hypothetical protein
MTCIISYNPEDGFVLATFNGVEDLASLITSIHQTVQGIQKYNCRKVISDHSNSTLHMTVTEMAKLDKTIHTVLEKNGLQPIMIRRAIVAQKSHANMTNYHFFETYSNNHFSNVKLFADIEEAKRWLKEQ